MVRVAAVALIALVALSTVADARRPRRCHRPHRPQPPSTNPEPQVPVYPSVVPPAATTSAEETVPAVEPSEPVAPTTTTTPTVTPTTTPVETPESTPVAGDHQGEITYYDVGLGSCGQTTPEGEHVVALNAPDMTRDYNGNPNSNPLCNKKVRVATAKGEVVARIVDTCPGCKPGDLDLSPGAFEIVADLSAGRVPATWSFV
ncbi:hypothetical protein H4R35_000421 [Dimargaris xerosporica]|nr:hypothetical protein H4R35_000421 [Dimargaris xerosporica]